MVPGSAQNSDFATPKKGVELTGNQKSMSVNVILENEEKKEEDDDHSPMQVDSAFTFKPAVVHKK